MGKLRHGVMLLALGLPSCCLLVQPVGDGLPLTAAGRAPGGREGATQTLRGTPRLFLDPKVYQGGK